MPLSSATSFRGFRGSVHHDRARDARGRHTTPGRAIPPSFGSRRPFGGVCLYTRVTLGPEPWPTSRQLARHRRWPEASFMRIFLLWLLLSVSLVAQQPASRAAGPAPTYKNLKVLAAKSDIPFVMVFFNEALGVQCTYCHVQGDPAADDNPKKEMARKMINMVRVID